MPFSEDRGIDIRLQTRINLAGASFVEAKVKKPDLKTETWAMGIYNEELGILQYITALDKDELGIIGTWQMQAKISFVTGHVYHGVFGTFTVSDVLFKTEPPP